MAVQSPAPHHRRCENRTRGLKSRLATVDTDRGSRRQRSCDRASTFVAESDRRMRAVAERFILRCAAATQGHAVSYFVIEAIGAEHLHTTAQPQWTSATLGGVFDQPDRRLVLLLDRFTGRGVPGHQPSRGAVAGLANKILVRNGVASLVHETPHRPVGIAETRERAKALDVGQ